LCVLINLKQLQGAGHLTQARIELTEHDAIPGKFGLNSSGMTQLRSVIAYSEVKNA